MNSGIYKIRNLITNDFYIGSAVNLNRRFSDHRYYLKYKNHHNIILQNVYNKYGLEKLAFEIVEIVEDKNNLISREQYYIDTLNPKYNICRVDGNCLGIKRSKQTRKKMSEAKRNISTITRTRRAAAQSKPFKILSPEGEIVEGINLQKFCNEHNLRQSSMCNVVHKRRKSHKGWISLV